MIGGIVLAAFVSPAIANEYWVQYDYSTHECSVAEKKSDPNEAGTTQSGPPATPTQNMASTPTASTMPTIVPGSEAPANTTVIAGSPDAPNDVTAPGSPPPTSGTQAAAPGTPTAADAGDNKDDPFAALARTWARKKAEAEAAGTADVTIGLIGTAQHSREDAEAEMQIMRKCGIAN